MDADAEEMERFFKRMNKKLRPYSSMDISDLQDDELKRAYPIQLELRNTKERYTEIELMQVGGMKSIYRLFDRQLGKAICLAQPRGRSREEVESFLREARLTASLQHPNIITVFDIGFDTSGMPYFTMELLQGRHLGRVIGDASLSDSQLLEVFNKICHAVAYAHSLGVMHLDLKPENIQVGDFGEVHLCDWGLAKIILEDDAVEFAEELDPNILNHATLHGRVKGSPGYMAPEQAMDDGEKDMRTDVYALGAILYTIFTGKAPIRSKAIENLINNTAEGNIIPFAQTTHVSKRMQAIIYKCLALQAEERYQSVQDLQDDLDKYTEGFAVVAEEASLWVHIQLLIKRHKKTFGFVLALFLIFSAFLMAAFFRIENERKLAVVAEKEARHQMDRAEENAQRLLEEKILTEELREESRKLIMQIAKEPSLASSREKIKLLEYGLSVEEDAANREILWIKLAKLHFVAQEFGLAQEAINQINRPGFPPRLRKACVEGEKALKKNGRLSHPQAASILATVFHPANLELILAFYQQHMTDSRGFPYSNQEYLPLARIVLNAYNRFWENNSVMLSFDSEKSILKASPPGYRNFILDNGLNILKPFQFNELDVSDTAFFEWMQLRGLRFKRINISGCRPNRITTKRVRVLKDIGIEEVVYDSRFLTIKENKILDDNF